MAPGGALPSPHATERDRAGRKCGYGGDAYYAINGTLRTGGTLASASKTPASRTERHPEIAWAEVNSLSPSAPRSDTSKRPSLFFFGTISRPTGPNSAASGQPKTQIRQALAGLLEIIGGIADFLRRFAIHYSFRFPAWLQQPVGSSMSGAPNDKARLAKAVTYSREDDGAEQCRERIHVLNEPAPPVAGFRRGGGEACTTLLEMRNPFPRMAVPLPHAAHCSQIRTAI
jgi:hypothetical protein